VGDAWDVDASAWWRTVEVNLRGAFLCARRVIPGMVVRRRGRIVNVTSHAGAFRWPHVSAYAISKAAVIKLTENLGVEIRSSGLTVFSVDPGLTPIGLSEAVLAWDPPTGSPEGVVQHWIRQQLDEGRGADPLRAAELVVRLAAGALDCLSGRHLSVHDDLETMLADLDEVLHNDLYQLRVGLLPANSSSERSESSTNRRSTDVRKTAS
jgi:NAD(P)-dependent dehydrogenase (short-subunit alcohol dehydrogenase family)